MEQMSRRASLSRRYRSPVFLAGLAGCLACSGGGATTAKTDGAAGAGASLGGGSGQGGARDAGAGGAGGASGRDGGGVGIVVRGFVYDKFDVAVVGANVRIGSTIVQAGADGSFEIDDVVPPYDLDVWTPGTRGSYGTLVGRYLGLTRADPALHFFEYIQPPHQTTLNVTLSAPLPANEVANCQFANPARSEAMGQAGGGVTQGSTFSMTVAWYTAATSISGTLSCLVYKNNALDPTGYDTFASSPVTLTDGTPASAMLTLAPVSTGTLMVGVALGTSTVADLWGDILVAGGAAHPIGNGAPIPTNPGPILVPQIPGATLTLTAEGGTADVHIYTARTGFPASATLVNLSLLAPVSVTSPADGATMVDTATPLTWSVAAGAANNVTISPGDLKGTQFNIFTAQTSTTIPDLTAQGIPLPAGATYTWQVTSYGPSVSIDDMTSPTEFPCLADLPGNCDFSVTQGSTFTLR